MWKTGDPHQSRKKHGATRTMRFPLVTASYAPGRTLGSADATVKASVGCGERSEPHRSRKNNPQERFPDDRIPSRLAARRHMVFHSESCRAAEVVTIQRARRFSSATHSTRWDHTKDGSSRSKWIYNKNDLEGIAHEEPLSVLWYRPYKRALRVLVHLMGALLCLVFLCAVPAKRG